MIQPTRQIAADRVKAFIDRQKSSEYGETRECAVRYVPSRDPVAFAEKDVASLRPLPPGERWGTAWSSAWFLIEGRVPESWAGQEVVLRVDIEAEGLLFDDSGVPLQGLSNGGVWEPTFIRQDYRLFPRCAGGEPVRLWVEGACNDIQGIEQPADPAPGASDRYGRKEARLRMACLSTIDREARAFLIDVEVLYGLFRALPGSGVRSARVLRGLNDALDLLAREGGDRRGARALLRPLLEGGAAPSDLTAWSVGHAHLDTAWLWPVRETVRKCGRTWANQLELMKRYPGFVFGASAALHYQFVKDRYPALHEQVKQRVREGRWEIQGALWVEADSVLSSGESLVRQITHGIRFFQSEFGVEPDNVWLPDAFGFSANWPQLMKRAGLKYFVSQKMCWSQTNAFPHHTFLWQGIDGSEVIAHFLPENDYNGHMMPGSLAAAQDRFREREILDGFLVTFGMGDGGGGSCEEEIERGLRETALEGCPRVRFAPAAEFLHSLDGSASLLSRWTGELYLELHRGTLTTQARVKKGNRKLEYALQRAEYLCSLLPPGEYPRAELDRLWKVLLVNQFHDILPGSSITMVYAQTRGEHQEALEACEMISRRAAERLCPVDPEAVVAVNDSPRAIRSLVDLPAGWEGCVAGGGDGELLAVQAGGGRAQALVRVAASSSLALRRAAAGACPAAPGSVAADGVHVEKRADGTFRIANALVRYVLDGAGRVLEGTDLEDGGGIIAAGRAGNALTLYDDTPNAWDAWDVEEFYRRTPVDEPRGVRVEGVVEGPAFASILLVGTIGDSPFRQAIRLERGGKRLDFDTEIDWREKHKMLRVAFPTAVRADAASFEIQYGYIGRGTHENTSWDSARFEAVGHSFADLSSPRRGTAVLNDCKYGWWVRENVIELALLRSPTYPDPDADAGVHAMLYSLCPHQGHLALSEVFSEAASVNRPPLVLPGRAGVVACPIRVAQGPAEIAVLKRGDADDRLYVRLVEYRGIGGTVILDARGIERIEETDLRERPIGAAFDTVDGKISFSCEPFEIRTFRLTARKGAVL